jgi:hypothetical protein
MDAMVPDGHGAAPRQVVIPRESGIQYAANFRFYHGRLGILDHPLSRMMTTEVWRAGIHQTRLHILAARCARAMEEEAPKKTEGAGKAGCPLHPRPRV